MANCLKPPKKLISSFVTGDQTLPYEQNLTGRRIAVLVLSTIDRDILKSKAPWIVAALDNVTQGSIE
jgi:hypothetical protein